MRQGPFADLSSGKGAMLPGLEGVHQAAFRGFLVHGGEGGPGAGVAGPGGGARRVDPGEHLWGRVALRGKWGTRSW